MLLSINSNKKQILLQLAKHQPCLQAVYCLVCLSTRACSFVLCWEDHKLHWGQGWLKSTYHKRQLVVPYSTKWRPTRNLLTVSSQTAGLTGKEVDQTNKQSKVKNKNAYRENISTASKTCIGGDDANNIRVYLQPCNVANNLELLNTLISKAKSQQRL